MLSVTIADENDPGGRMERSDVQMGVEGPMVKHGTALVSMGRDRWVVGDGESISIGRQSSCEVRIGAGDPGPEDLGVSRRAATLSHAQGRIWIRNDSTTQPVRVQPDAGEGYVLDRGDMVSLAESRVDLVVEGQVKTYRITVELPVGTARRDEDEPVTVSPATQGALPLKPRERRLLAALCEPLLKGSGRQARPASYREVAARLRLSDHTVRNQLDALRDELLRRGIPGMIGPDAKDNLARYAVRSGSVTPSDLTALEEERGNRGFVGG